MPEQLSGLLIHPAGTPCWILRPVKVSTSSKLYRNYFRLPTFLDCSGIQFFDSPFSPNTVKLPLVTLQDALPCQRSPHASQPTFN